MAIPSVLQIRTAQVVRVHRVTPEVFLLELALAAEDRFAFQAGQWVYLHLLNDAGEPLARGAFSIASAPSEAGETLLFGINIYGQLTASLAELSVGSRVGVQGPFGVFVLPSEKAPLVLLAGGIGITPLRSLAREALDRGWSEPIHLLWASKTQEDLLYHEDFETWAKAYPKTFFYHPTLTRDPHPEWKGERGRVDEEKLQALAVDWERVHAFVCGPEAFMAQTRQLLQVRGIVGKPRLHEEKF